MKKKLIYESPVTEQIEMKVEKNFMGSQESMKAITGSDWEEDD